MADTVGDKTTSAIDLVERLNWWGRPKCRIQNDHAPLKRDCREAADTITRLQAALDYIWNLTQREDISEGGKVVFIAAKAREHASSVGGE